MKKIIKLLCLISALGLFTTAIVSAGDTPATGGWTATEDTSVTKDAEEALSKALETYVGSEVRPVALLGTQVVAGVNYCLLCSVTPVTLNAVPHYSLVYVYAGINGTCEILGFSDLDLAAGYSELMQETK